MTARIAPAFELSQSLERSACSLERSQNPSSPDVSSRRLELFFEFGIAIGANLPPQHYRFVRAHAGVLSSPNHQRAFAQFRSAPLAKDPGEGR